MEYIKLLDIEIEKLKKNCTFLCINEWKYDHFEIGDTIKIVKFSIEKTPWQLAVDEGEGIVISYKIYNKELQKNSCTNHYFTLKDWQFFMNCFKVI